VSDERRGARIPACRVEIRLDASSFGSRRRSPAIVRRIRQVGQALSPANRLFRSLIPLVLLATAAAAQQHVAWSVSVEPAAVAPGAAALVRIHATIDPGWHLYAASSPAGIPASFVVSMNGAAARTRLYQTAPKRAFDANFNSQTETFEGTASFALVIETRNDATRGPVNLKVAARFQTCNDNTCVPGKWSETAKLTIDPAIKTTGLIFPLPGLTEVKPPAPTGAAAPPQTWTLFLLTAFGFGLASIFTPCCFPMIPITMSYFLNRQFGRRDAIVQAVVFCLGIIVLFSALGLVTTALLGPVAVVQLGASSWVNGFIAALFIVFSLSLLGAFEITIPSSILTRLNRASGSGSFAGTLLMGLTYSLASFACVGPFVGTLLAASVSGGGLRPLVGMVTFATGMALPFFLLALFPAMLKRMPRSGGWLARVKIVMGFVILAASLKYLTAVDQTLGWGWITRERFLAAWIVLFAMAGLYLLGLLRLEGVKPDEPLRLGRLAIATAFLIFSVSLIPGMSGRKLGDLDAYVPAPAERAAAAGERAAPSWLKDQYKQALDQARREGKLVFLNFTGVACANCHWMEANMLPRPEIAAALDRFVLVELFTDRTDAVSEANEKLEETKFGTVAEPYYAIVRPDETVVATFEGRTTNAPEFLAFLNRGTAEPAPTAQTAPQDANAERFTALDGRVIDGTGKVLVLDFWATWCVPCIQEMPQFNRIYRDLSPKGLALAGIAMDEEGASIVQPFLARHPADYPITLGSAAIGKKYNVENLPVTLVFDRSGKLVKRFDGFTKEPDLRAAIQAAL
jgi:thiol:disulfide interchange protein DsbD